MRSIGMQIEHMLAEDRANKHENVNKVSQDGMLVDGAARALNEALKHAERNDAQDITEDTFCDLLERDLQMFPNLSEDVRAKIHAIRAMFANRDMAKIVADYTHTRAEQVLHKKDVYKESQCGKCLDWIGLLMIVINAVVLAVNSDVHPEWLGWIYIELLFTGFFLVELCLKFWLCGRLRLKRRYSFQLSVHVFFRGPDRNWNIADVVVVSIACCDAMMTLVGKPQGGGLFTLMRLCRVARISKLVGVLRHKMFKELLLMIKGVISGLRTLIWAIVLLFLVIAVLGLCVRQTLGDWCDDSVQPVPNAFCTSAHLIKHNPNLFQNFPVASMTVYRCFTEGCASVDGTPLLPHIWDNAGGKYMVLAYTVSYLVVTFGLFNLIVAVFVENTMQAATKDEKRRRQLRMMRQVEIARKLQKLVSHFVVAGDPELKSSRELDRARTEMEMEMLPRNSFDFKSLFRRKKPPPEHEWEFAKVANLDQEITRDMFEAAVADPDTEALLEELDITLDDPMNLFEALDADGGGTIDVGELVKGLMKLLGGGETMKNDMVSTLLSVRSSQRCLQNFDLRAVDEHKALLEQHKNMQGVFHAFEDRIQEYTSHLDQALAPPGSSAPHGGQALRSPRTKVEL